MNDILNVPLSVGNYVVFRMPQYSGITIGKIIKITPRKVRVQYINDWNYQSGQKFDTPVDPSSVCKIDGPDALSYVLKAGL